MDRLGIRIGSDLRAQTLEFLRQHFGKAAAYFYWIARAVDERTVCVDRVRKSIGAENTFSSDLFTVEEARAALEPIIAKVWRYCAGTTVRARTVTLKAKYADFRQITRSRTERAPFTSQAAIELTVFALLDSLFPVTKGIRLLGVTLSSLGVEADSKQQLRLSI
jgi:DNA polymerase-4